MTHPRIIETDQGIQGEFNVAMYDQMQRHLRDKGWIMTKELLKQGLTRGCALEIGPGPGYLGLEWLKHTTATTLKGLDISRVRMWSWHWIRHRPAFTRTGNMSSPNPMAPYEMVLR